MTKSDVTYVELSNLLNSLTLSDIVLLITSTFLQKCRS